MKTVLESFLDLFNALYEEVTGNYASPSFINFKFIICSYLLSKDSSWLLQNFYSLKVGGTCLPTLVGKASSISEERFRGFLYNTGQAVF